VEGKIEGWTFFSFLLPVLGIPDAFIIRRLLKKMKLVSTSSVSRLVSYGEFSF
jgi:hypothetical protein